jgi:hypothetical protein
MNKGRFFTVAIWVTACAANFGEWQNSFRAGVFVFLGLGSVMLSIDALITQLKELKK